MTKKQQLKIHSVIIMTTLRVNLAVFSHRALSAINCPQLFFVMGIVLLTKFLSAEAQATPSIHDAKAGAIPGGVFGQRMEDDELNSTL